jgi:urease accessory protein
MAKVQQMPSRQSRDSASLQAFFRLSSASLPIGGYSYSQALESAVAHGHVQTDDDLRTWISSALQLWTGSDALIWAAGYRMLQANDFKQLTALNRRYWASRDTAELRMESEQMGWSLIRLLDDLQWIQGELRACLMNLSTPTFLIAHVSGCYTRSIELETGLLSFCLSFVENQVQSGQKLLPIGQAAGQRLISDLGPVIDRCIDKVLSCDGSFEDHLHTAAPLHSLLSARHEVQYSRLFRS